MLRRQLASAFMIALGLAVVGSLFAEQRVRQAQRQLVRANAATRTFDGLQDVGAHADQILRLLSESAITGEFDRAMSEDIQTRVARTIEALRQRIEVEVGLDRDLEPNVPEAQAFEALTQLEADLQRGIEMLQDVGSQRAVVRAVWLRGMDLLDGREPDGFRERLNRAIAEERRETEVSRVAAEAAMATLGRAARVYVLGSVVLLLALSYVFVGRLRKPVDELVAATQAMKAGDLDRRARIDRRDEFGLIASHFNALADLRQHQQRELANAKERLEETVARRTEELRIANERLVRADATRRQLFADISHELRTPITAIRGEADIGLRGGAKPVDDYRLALTQISTIAGQMGRLIDDLLFVARSDAGAHRMDMERVSLGAVLDAVCLQARALGHDHGIAIAFEAWPDVSVWGDFDRLHQLFMILLDNAIRYSEAPSTVHVRSTVADGRVTVDVVDRGAGMAEYELVNAFRRFYRGDRSAATEGAGLGLPIAKAIVDAHGGVIEIDSVAGTGTTVRVTLVTQPVAEGLS